MIFGTLAIRPKELARIMATKVVPMVGRMERRNALKFGNNENAPKRRALRTRAVKTVLRREGKNLRLRAYPDNDKRLKAPVGQWLLDLIWWDDRNARKAVELAVGCEWNTPKSEVLHDFEKLLAIKSPLKLMIYRVRKKAEMTYAGPSQVIYLGFDSMWMERDIYFVNSSRIGVAFVTCFESEARVAVG